MCWVLITGPQNQHQTLPARDRRQLAADRQQREQERRETGSRGRRASKGYVCPSVYRNAPEIHTGESGVPAIKGLTGFKYPLMPDGSLLLELVDESGAVAAAQTITPHGEKRLPDGFGKAQGISRRKRARIAAERFNCRGLATALSSSPDAPGRAGSGSN